MSAFDRIRARSDEEPLPSSDAPLDREGRSALWSDVAATPSVGAVSVTCSECEQTSVLGFRAALKAATPSVHLPYLRRNHGSYLRCPACGRRTWVSLAVRV